MIDNVSASDSFACIEAGTTIVGDYEARAFDVYKSKSAMSNPNDLLNQKTMSLT